MSSPLNVEKINRISQRQYGPDSVSWQVELDGTLGSSCISLDEREGPKIWQAFLSLPHVYCFEQGRKTYAYNFEKVEQVLIAGHFGRFIFDDDRRYSSSSVFLDSLHLDAFDQALSAFRQWLRVHLRTGQEANSLLTIFVPVSLSKHQLVSLGELFPDIQHISSTQQTHLYRWSFPLEDWLNEAQLMALGLLDHVIMVPGGATGGDEQTRIHAVLSMNTYPGEPFQENWHSVPTSIANRRGGVGYRVLGVSLLIIGFLSLVRWRQWRRRNE